MKKSILVVCALMLLPALLLSLQTTQNTDEPRYTADGSLQFPENYREWVWLSSGLGMAYGPAARPESASNPPFDNVFVTPGSYRAFLQTGKWPDKTMFVLELRASATEASINKQGRFQSQVRGIEVEVKDVKRFPMAWAFFPFGPSAAGKAVKSLPATEDCYSCHAQNGAVDNTFVQFYPTLIDAAKKYGTFK